MPHCSTPLPWHRIDWISPSWAMPKSSDLINPAAHPHPLIGLKYRSISSETDRTILWVLAGLAYQSIIRQCSCPWRDRVRISSSICQSVPLILRLTRRPSGAPLATRASLLSSWILWRAWAVMTQAFQLTLSVLSSSWSIAIVLTPASSYLTIHSVGREQLRLLSMRLPLSTTLQLLTLQSLLIPQILLRTTLLK
jgi:hypothetical protein